MLTLFVAINSLKKLDTVGQALIDTLQQAFGDAFTDELRKAWLSMYNTVATVIINAAKK